MLLPFQTFPLLLLFQNEEDVLSFLYWLQKQSIVRTERKLSLGRRRLMSFYCMHLLTSKNLMNGRLEILQCQLVFVQ